MKRMIASTLALFVFVTLTPAVYAAQHCTAATIKGNYGFTFSGFSQDANGNNVPFYGTGVATNDGEGNAVATINASLNGNFMTFPWIGTYIVNPDCTGTGTSTNGQANFSVVIVRGGAEYMSVSTNPGLTFTVDFKQID
jgi:hypothetical protein